MIQPAHVDLERERIRTRIVSAAGAGGGFDGVVAADIIGGDGHANREDERRGGEYKDLQVSRGVATTLPDAFIRRPGNAAARPSRNSVSVRCLRISDRSTSPKS